MPNQKNKIISINRYQVYLELSAEWLMQSIAMGKGGSCAHYSHLIGWSKPYPETTGYLIPTLFRLSKFLNNSKYSDSALSIGQWLLDIQLQNGSWRGGLHPGSSSEGSVFNTGQIIKGMMALFHNTGDQAFLMAADRAANWLASCIDSNGLWPAGDYKASKTPSYYSHVAWPMLEVWQTTQSDFQRTAAESFLDNALKRKLQNGAIAGWGFNDSGPAFTHTIAYTIRGFQESSRLLQDNFRYANEMEQVLNFFIQKAELTNGRLPGEFNESLVGNQNYVCLTGNAQLAICIMVMEQQKSDLRLINAAAKLIDFVGSVQGSGRFSKNLKGAVAGSYPIWGRYMFMRYPNWSAKYFCDSLMMISSRLEEEI
jgi:hypothetical protein